MHMTNYKLYMSTILYPQFQNSKISEYGKFRLIYNYSIQPVKKTVTLFIKKANKS